MRNSRTKHKLPHGHETYFASYFSWCGHCTDHDERSEKGIKQENMVWLQSLTKELGSQCHGRRFRVWRWEQAMAQCLGNKLVNVAQHSIVWRSKLEELINRKNG